ncbi:uncharacterized protein LOC126625675 isoform X2 [Malus sylvestris]|uniref:uncharacterized protein n=1 Tax=Malus domestica TaxID=3750 RepID=UPI0021AD1E66|nr:uncharacterized protein LOC126625675 isoform X2 [Malus sylvestris]
MVDAGLKTLGQVLCISNCLFQEGMQGYDRDEYGRSSDEYEDYEDNEDGEEYEEEEENSEEFHPHYICTLQFPVGLKSSIFFHMLTSLLKRNIQKDKHGMKL